jgi:transposase
LLIWDGTGVWLRVRRLHRGRFTWPQSDDVTWTLNQAEWRWLTRGVDWRRLQAKPSAQWPV